MRTYLEGSFESCTILYNLPIVDHLLDYVDKSPYFCLINLSNFIYSAIFTKNILYCKGCILLIAFWSRLI